MNFTILALLSWLSRSIWGQLRIQLNKVQLDVIIIVQYNYSSILNMI